MLTLLQQLDMRERPICDSSESYCLRLGRNRVVLRDIYFAPEIFNDAIDECKHFKTLAA